MRPFYCLLLILFLLPTCRFLSAQNQEARIEKSQWKGTEKPQSAWYYTWRNYLFNTDWDTLRQLNFTWDEEGRMLSDSVLFNYPPFTNEFKQVYTYDTQGNLTRSDEYHWGLEWKSSDWAEYDILYDSLDRIVYKEEQGWSLLTSEFGPVNREMYTYDSTGGRSHSIFEIYLGGGAWRPDHQDWITNYPDGKMKTVISQNWSHADSLWINSKKRLYSGWLDMERNLFDTLTYQAWDGTTWLNSSRHVCSLLAFEGFIQEMHVPDSVSGWRNKSRENIINDSLGNWVYSFMETWGGTSWNISHEMRNDLVYGSDGKLLSELRRTKLSSGSWMEMWKYEYLYEESLPTPEDGTSAIVWPNPSDGILNFAWDISHLNTEVELFDAAGRKILAGHFEDTDRGEWDVSAFSAGLYLIQFSFEDGTITSKKLMLR